MRKSIKTFKVTWCTIWLHVFSKQPFLPAIWLPHVYENMRGITSSSFPTLQTHKQKKAEDMNTRVCNISEYLKYLQKNNGTKDYTLLTFQVQ